MSACVKNCYDIKAVFTCGHYQCRLTRMHVNWCIRCGCNEPNEELKKETHDFLVECGIIADNWNFKMLEKNILKHLINKEVVIISFSF